MGFHQHWVDPKVRRIRLSAFGVANTFPLRTPHLRVAGIKHVYSRDPKFLKHGFCDNLTVKQAKEALQKHSATAELAERVLLWLHKNTRDCGAESFKIVSALGREVFGAVIGARGDDRTQQVLRAARKASEKLAVLKAKMPDSPFELAIAEQPPATAGKPAAAAGLAPKIIRYVEGKPVMSQDVKETKLFTEHHQWDKFFDAKDGSQPLQDEADKATVLVAVLRLAARVPRPDVALARGEDRKLRASDGLYRGRVHSRLRGLRIPAQWWRRRTTRSRLTFLGRSGWFVVARRRMMRTVSWLIGKS